MVFVKQNKFWRGVLVVLIFLLTKLSAENNRKADVNSHRSKADTEELNRFRRLTVVGQVSLGFMWTLF